MVRTRLEILDSSKPFVTDIPVAITFNLADVREPDKRKASFSKTISLYGTNEINKLFENIFEVNLSTQYFNKNLKTPCKYYVDEILNFKGDLQLIKINIKPDGLIEYECSIIGEGGTLFVEIGDKYITGNTDSVDDLDFSAYNHTYDRTYQQVTSRSNYGTGLGIVYPLIDRGTNGGSDTVYNVEDFLPCFHKYEMIKKIINKAGYTFTSSILESAEFKKQITYPNIAGLTLSSAQLANRQFYVGLSSDVTLTLNTLIDVNHTNTSTLGFFDAGSQSSGTVVTLNESGNYNLCAVNNYSVSFTHTDPSVVKCALGGLAGYSIIAKSSDGGVSYFNLTTNNQYAGGAYSYFDGTNKLNVGVESYFTNSVATGELYFAAGDKIKHKAEYHFVSGTITYYNSGGGIVTTGTGTITVKLVSGQAKTSLYALATQKTVMAGNTLEVNNALPIKIKQKDYLKSVLQALNCYVDVDPDNENNLIIESFDEFYNTNTPINYENKTDLDKEQTINPNLLEGKRYIWTYSKDSDYWNAKYLTDHGEVFGTETLIVENDFIKSDKKNEIVFSATPNVANYGLGIAHPRIYLKEGLSVKTTTPNIRWLICGGVKTATNPITFKQSGLSDLVTYDYLYAGHTDDPFDPTVDLNFGLPKEVYYSYVNAYFTTNNLYNRYHKYYIETITDRDSKIVTKYLYVNAKDINEFNFRNRLFIDGAYYIVNKIENYNPIDDTSTKFELIKLKNSNVFTPSSILISDSSVSTGTNTFSAKLNNSINLGNNVINKGSNCIAIGENIFIPETASNVTVIGNNITVSENVSNVSLVNVNDLTVDETYNNASLNGLNSAMLVDADTTALAGIKTYLVDTVRAGADVKITIPDGLPDGIELVFKRSEDSVSAAYRINFLFDVDTIEFDPPGTYELIPSYKDSVTIVKFNSNWNVIY